jgi:hypothetical protein
LPTVGTSGVTLDGERQAPGLLGLDVGTTTVAAFRAAWDTDRVLVRTRSRVVDRLTILPPPLGFGPRARRRPARSTARTRDGA